MHKMFTRSSRVFVTGAGCLMLGWWALPAHAYLDPGTGSMLIQAVIGAIAAVGVTLRLYWHKIRLMFSSRTADQKSDDVGSAADADADPPIKEN